MFPSSLKKAIIFPSLKKGNPDSEEYNSYRPISNIAFLSKTLERAASIQTTTYLLENDLFAKFQSAYRRYHSTETALICVMNNILREIDSGNEVVLVMLDLSAAFDTIDHALFLERLQHRYGISGTALKWFQSNTSTTGSNQSLSRTHSRRVNLCCTVYHKNRCSDHFYSPCTSLP